MAWVFHMLVLFGNQKWNIVDLFVLLHCAGSKEINNSFRLAGLKPKVNFLTST